MHQRRMLLQSWNASGGGTCGRNCREGPVRSLGAEEICLEVERVERFNPAMFVVFLQSDRQIAHTRTSKGASG